MTGAQPLVAGAGAQALLERVGEACVRDPHVDTQPELPRVAHAREHGDRRTPEELVEILETGDAAAPGFGLPTSGVDQHLVVGRGRDDRIGEPVRVLLEHAGGLAVVVAEDGAALGDPGVARDARACDRRAVEPPRVAIAAAQHRVVARRHPIEIDRCRPAAPVVLVEAATEDPGAFRQVARVRRDAFQGLLQCRGVRDVEPRHLLRPPDEVHVRVEPAGDHEPAAKVHRLRVTGVAAHLIAPADGGDASVAREERFGARPIADMDATAFEQDLLHPRNPAWPRSGTNLTCP